MDAEEKKSSPDTESGSFPDRQTGFKQHNFPNIPVDDPDSERICARLKDNFQRIQYDVAPIDSDLPSACRQNIDRSVKSPSSSVNLDELAYQKGLKDGLAKGARNGQQTGFERAAKKLEPVLASLQQGLRKLKDLRRDTFHSIEKEVVELALAIARKIICREIAVDKEVVVAVAREALAKVDDPANIKIKMNPADLQFINETKYQISELVGSIEKVSLEAEDSVQSGGCVIETNLGEIDARIENQLQAIEESFRAALKDSS